MGDLANPMDCRRCPAGEIDEVRMMIVFKRAARILHTAEERSRGRATWVIGERVDLECIGGEWSESVYWGDLGRRIRDRTILPIARDAARVILRGLIAVVAREVTVDGCGDCPAWGVIGEGWLCGLGDEPGVCPLRSGPVLLRLED